jgi:hypothetical protein
LNVWRERTVLLRSGTPNTLGVDSRCRLTDLLFVHHLHRSSSVSRCIDSEAEPRDYGLRWTRRLETLNAPSTSVVHTSTYESNEYNTHIPHCHLWTPPSHRCPRTRLRNNRSPSSSCRLSCASRFINTCCSLSTEKASWTWTISTTGESLHV